MTGLGADAMQCVALLAVCGRPVDAGGFGDALAWPAPRVVAATGELVRSGFVARFWDEYRLADDLAQDEVLTQLPPPLLAQTHRKCASALRRRAEGDVHLLLDAFEHERAVGAATPALALEIARSPSRRLLGQSGLDYLVGIARAPNPDRDSSLALDFELAGMAADLGDPSTALALLTDLSAELPTRAERAVCALRAARHAFEMERVPEMVSMLQRTRHEGLGDPWMTVGADALEYLRLSWLEHDHATADTYRRRAVASARSLVEQAGSVEELTEGARRAFADAMDAERLACLRADDMQEMLARIDELIEATRGMGERHLDARLAASVPLRFLNRWPEAEQRVVAVLDEAQREVSPASTAAAQYQLALVLYNLGHVEEAARVHEDARRAGVHLDAYFEASDTWLCGLRQLIELSTGDWQASLQSLRSQAEQQGHPHCRLILRQRAALWAARFAEAGCAVVVPELLASAQMDADLVECPRCDCELPLVAAESLARIGATDLARERLATWDQRHPCPLARARFMHQRASAVLASAEDDADALAQIRAVIAEAAAAGTRLEELWGLIDLGVVQARRDVAAAAGTWSAAARLAAGLGAASEQSLVRRHLRELGVRWVDRSVVAKHAEGPLGALSRRELEVAQLAASGTSNANIARSLFISEKTVEQHVSRVLTKLGVHNRVELAARYRTLLDAAPGSIGK